MATELENKLRLILTDKNTNLLPENLKKGITCLGRTGKLDMTSFSDYDTCLNKTKAILGTADLIPVLNGLVLDLEANSNNVANSDGVIWIDNINSKQISINNGSVDTDNSIIFNGTNTSFDSGITQDELKNGYTVITRIRPIEWGNYKGVFGLHGSAGLVGLQYQDGLIYYSHLPIKNKITISPDVLAVNAWHTVTCSYYGTAGKIYVDGKLVASGKLDTLSPLGNLIFGYCYNDTNRYFKGNISHCIVYNRELSDSEIKIINDYIEDTTIGKKLSYIQSSGTQYIDTGVGLGASSIRYEAKFLYPSGSKDGFLWSSYDGTTYGMGDLYNDSEKRQLGYFYGNDSKIYVPSPTYSKDLIYIADVAQTLSSITSTINNITTTLDRTAISPTQSIKLFRRGTVSNYPGIARLYYLKLYADGELVRDFIPVKDAADIVCLYDKVSKTHFYNQGTGDFIGGGV